MSERDITEAPVLLQRCVILKSILRFGTPKPKMAARVRLGGSSSSLGRGDRGRTCILSYVCLRTTSWFLAFLLFCVLMFLLLWVIAFLRFVSLCLRGRSVVSSYVFVFLRSCSRAFCVLAFMRSVFLFLVLCAFCTCAFCVHGLC